MPLCIELYKQLQRQQHGLQQANRTIAKPQSPIYSKILDVIGYNITHSINSSSTNSSLYQTNSSDTYTGQGVGGLGASGSVGESTLVLHEYQVIKCVVLIVVLSALMLSTCKIVFQSSARHGEGKDDRPEPDF